MGFDIKEVALLLYKGSLTTDESNEEFVGENKMKVKELATEVALANKPFWKEKLATKLDADLCKYIKEVDLDKEEEPYCDRFGRVTYYYAELADRRIWLYQPGTIMFESGVKDGELKICSGGSQQNGGILGNGCAAFLCKFTATLICKYEKIKAAEGKTASGLIAKVYSDALTATLIELAFEDYSQHGRLLVMKDQTISIADEELTDKQLMMFYVKDIMIYRLKEYPGLTFDAGTEHPPTEEEIFELMKTRYNESKFCRHELFYTG